MLDLGKTSAIRFNVEIKSSEKMQGLVLPPEEISRSVVNALRKHRLESRAMIQSFATKGVQAHANGGGLDAKAEPRPAASFAAAETSSRADGCGTAERPCVLQEIRVAAPVAE